MAPRSIEQRIRISMARNVHLLAFLSRSCATWFVTHLDGISRFCAVYSFTGLLFTLLIGTMISRQPLYIKGINKENQELTKESAFGAMGMFLFLFTLSLFYLCCVKGIRGNSRGMHPGYMRPMRPPPPRGLSDYQVELSDSSPESERSLEESEHFLS